MENWQEHLAALVPGYGPDGGNCTLIYTLQGQKIVDRRTVRWNLRRLARHYCIDLEAAREHYGGYLSWSQGVPIPFNAHLVLVPLKVRRVLSKNDGASGYFNVSAVEVHPDGSPGGYRSSLLLPGGYRIPCCYTKRAIDKRLKAGQMVLKCYNAGISPAAGRENLTAEFGRFLEQIIMAAVRAAGVQKP